MTGAPRCVWVDEGNDDDPAALKRNAIDYPFFSIRDQRVTREYLAARRQTYGEVGVYIVWNWYPNSDGAGLARILNNALTAIDSPDPGFPRVCVDIETHDVSYILAFLKAYRSFRPWRVTDWTLEGFQGGLFSRDDVLKIIAANVRIIPQMYVGNMKASAGDRVALDLVEHGFPPARIFGFYDAAALPQRWEGYAFTQGRLP